MNPQISSMIEGLFKIPSPSSISVKKSAGKFYSPLKDPSFVQAYKEILERQRKKILKLSHNKKKISPEDLPQLQKIVEDSFEIAGRIVSEPTMDSIRAEIEWLQLATLARPLYEKYFGEKDACK
jgi:hypothetical protein